MVLSIIFWLIKSIVILGIFHFVLLTVVNALTKNSFTKLPVMLMLAILAGIFMAWLKYVPYLLFLLWLFLTKHTLSAMTEDKFKRESGIEINKPLFYISYYSYVFLACASAWFLQIEICTGDKCTLLWKHYIKI